MSDKILAGRYEIIEKIGDGGMAVVYKGRDRLLNRFVAIKILRPEYTKDAVFVENFRKESQAAARLSHPGIVNVYDVGREEDVYYIVMELIEGQTLSDVIDEGGPMDYKQTIKLSKQIASALSVAHKNNIIHRDVKPHNVLIMPDGSAKITDFGIAKAVSDATIVDPANEAIMGSVHYFSPEQARGGYVDEKSDIYSLGIMIYEMLTGKVPFDADNPVTVAVMHMNDRPVPPSQLVSNIPPGLEQIVMKAIEKYQINRFKTADDMYEALDNVDFVSGIIENPEVMEKLRERQEELSEEGAGDSGEKGNDDVAVKKGNGNKGKKESGSEKKGMWKIRLLAVVLALACAVPASYFIYSVLKDMMGVNQSYEEVLIPRLVGLSADIAERNLAELKLKLEVVDRIPSSEIAEGIVVSQERPEGSKVKEGFTVKVNVSRGAPADPSETREPPEVAKTIPYLLGKQLEEALYTIEVYGYTTGDVSYKPDSGAEGSVISQSPDAGTEADSGTRISMVISEGQPKTVTVSMPNLLGLTEEAAKAALAEKGLSAGAVSAEPSQTVDAGLVISQQFAADVQVEQGSRVDFRLSSGSTALGTGGSGSAGNGGNGGSAGNAGSGGNPGDLRTVSIPIDFTEAPTEVFSLSVMLQDAEGNLIRIINRENRYKSMESESVSITGTGSTCIVYVYFSDIRVMMFGVDFDSGVVSRI